jgi:hypothetical protein
LLELSTLAVAVQVATQQIQDLQTEQAAAAEVLTAETMLLVDQERLTQVAVAVAVVIILELEMTEAQVVQG